MTTPHDDDPAVAPTRIDLRRLVQQHSRILATHTLTLAAARAHSTTADLLRQADPARWVTAPENLSLPDRELREVVAASIAVRARDASSPVVRRYLEDARSALLAGSDAVAARAQTIDSIAIAPAVEASPPQPSPADLIQDQARPAASTRSRRRDAPTTLSGSQAPDTTRTMTPDSGYGL